MDLSLRNQVRIVGVAVILLWLVSHALFIGTRKLLDGWDFWTLLFAAAVGIAVANLLARRALAQYRAALAREDLPAAKRRYEMIRDFWRRRGSETIKSYGINLLIVEGRYRDALEQLQALNIKKIGDKGAPVITSQIAWCLAQLGEPAKALEILRPTLQQLESLGPEYACSGHFILGACYFLLGKPEEAVPHLEKAKTTGSAARKSAVLFYLGESYAALGNTREERLAYQRAHEALPNGKFGIRALQCAQ